MSTLERSIKKWVKELRKNPSFEESHILEMESHLRMQIEEYVEDGLTEAEAFEKAQEQFGELDPIGDDVFKVRTTKLVARPSWKESAWMPLLFQNYIKTLARNISRNKFYTSLNLAGLTIGIACCLLIVLFVKDELSYDQHHEKKDRIHRVTLEFNDPSGNTHWAPIGPPVAEGLKNSLPGIENTTRLFPISGSYYVFKVENETFKAESGIYADSTLFDVFTYPLKYGDPKTALVRPSSIVISAEMAQAYFGDRDPIGESIQVVDWGASLTVTGVLEKVPSTTHFPFNFILSMSTYYRYVAGPNFNPDDAITWAGFYTYVLLDEYSSKDEVSSRLTDFVDTFYAQVPPPGVVPSDIATMYLQPLTDIHLYSDLEKEYRANSDMTYVYVFGIIAVFVLLIACANFINLTTARASNRMREIGIRKTLGARRPQLAFQFLGESVFLSMLALVLAYGLTILLLPSLNQVTGKVFEAGVLYAPNIVWSLVAVSLFAGLISGIYPALYMSGFSPVKVLKAVMPQSTGNAFLRKGLVVFQFAISIFLIIGTIIVYTQLDYIRGEQMGFDKEGVINIPLFGEFEDYIHGDAETVKQELLRNPDIISVSIGGDYPGKRFSVEDVLPDGREADEEIDVRIADDGIDHDFVKTMGINLVAGRDFSRQAPTDTNAWIINEAAVKKLSLDSPVGHVLHWNNYSGPIVGVVEDFNFRSLHNEVEALVIPLRPTRGNFLFVRTRAGDVSNVLADIEQKIKTFAPSAVFEYTFLSDEFDKLYRSEDQMSQVFWYFSLMAILIACLGLFGLSTFMINQRAKEIGIRKVMGASIQSILILVSSNFIKLVGVSFMIAAPVVYFAMNRWLSSFAYKVEVGVWMFIAAAALVSAIALLTIGFQAFKSAISNPVKSLRSE